MLLLEEQIHMAADDADRNETLIFNLYQMPESPGLIGGVFQLEYALVRIFIGGHSGFFGVCTK